MRWRGDKHFRRQTLIELNFPTRKNNASVKVPSRVAQPAPSASEEREEEESAFYFQEEELKRMPKIYKKNVLR